jgi:riboflavin kinase/FMN adenylyltransferase
MIMKIYQRLSDLRREKKAVYLAAGFFDGVHRGHKAVIRRVLREAKKHHAAAWLMTFDIHPLKLLQPLAAPPLLTSTAHKINLLKSCGVKGCIVLNFTPSMARQEPEKFIVRLAASAPKLRGMVVGRNWTFGRRGRGTPLLLKKLGALHGFNVSVVKPVLWRGWPVSSTRIRRAVTAGCLEEAKKMLGRTFSVVGTVVTGRGFGRRLGIPTANLDLHNEVIPPDGVYAVRATAGNKHYKGVANIGFRPTVQKSAGRRPTGRFFEVHLFSRPVNLYHRVMEVVFVKRLRPERKFATLAGLKGQITKDIIQARIILGT